MKNFILVEDDGSTYKCEPKLVKQLSEGEVSKFVSNSSIIGRVSTSNASINANRFYAMTHFASSLPSYSPAQEFPIHSVVENGKKVIFSKLKQLYFSGDFSPTSHDPNLVTLGGYSQAKGTKEIVYNTTLPWASEYLKSVCGVGVYFIPFTATKSTETYHDLGKDLFQADYENPATPRGVDNLLNHIVAPSAQHSLNFAMGIDGRPDAYFPLVSNIYEDLKVCLGRYEPGRVSRMSKSDENIFAIMTISFLFSQFNADLATATNVHEGVLATEVKKRTLLERIFCWNKSTLKYSPVITKEEILTYCDQHVVRKFALDIAKRTLDSLPS